jgi:hypothetical protein
MDTGEVLLLVGVAAVGFFVLTKATGTPTASTPVPIPAPNVASNSIVSRIQTVAGNIGGVTGAVVGGATGLTPVAGLLATNAKSLATETVGGFLTAGSGVKNIVSGNVGTGLEQIGKGAVQTALAPVTSVIHTLGGLL